jgi:hypothetical protein
VAPYGVRCIKMGTGCLELTGVSIEVNNFTPSRIGIIAVVSRYELISSGCVDAAFKIMINTSSAKSFFMHLS